MFLVLSGLFWFAPGCLCPSGAFPGPRCLASGPKGLWLRGRAPQWPLGLGLGALGILGPWPLGTLGVLGTWLAPNRAHGPRALGSWGHRALGSRPPGAQGPGATGPRGPGALGLPAPGPLGPRPWAQPGACPWAWSSLDWSGLSCSGLF